MELRHLRYFLAVVEELHFGRAAAKLHVSQPPLSKQIRDLEKELGVHLLARTSRKVELTKAGQFFAGEVRRLIEQLETASGFAAEVDREMYGRIVLGYSPGTVHLMGRILKRFAQCHPKIQFLLKSLDTSRQIEALHNGRIDVGLVTIALPVAREGLEFHTILRDRLVVAMPIGHSFSRRRLVPLLALANQELIMDPLQPNHGRHWLIVDICRRMGFTLNRVHEVDSIQQTMELIRSGFGISLVRASVRGMQPKGIVFRELQHSPILETAVTYRSANRSTEIMSSFTDQARNALAPASRARKIESGHCGEHCRICHPDLSSLLP